ncbi:hypothetical protein N665_0721s0006 [Sinapis alba]|nr:hypothetical protein N665_0721s0006 [Sinapis alba]
MKNLGTKHYQGGTDPFEADAWLHNLKQNFSATRCPVEFKDIDIYYLEKDAISWWEAYQFGGIRQSLPVSGSIYTMARSRLEAVEFHRLADLDERVVNVEEAISAERASASHSASPRRPSVQLQRQPSSVMQTGRRGRFFQGGRSGWPRPRTPTCFSCGHLVHVKKDCLTMGQFRPAVPSHITCFTCGEKGHYVTSCPHIHSVQTVVPSVPQVALIKTPLPLPLAKRQATVHRACWGQNRPSGPPRSELGSTRPACPRASLVLPGQLALGRAWSH